ncbi:hypothetical protein FA13DRAFT_815875 [Coprinellus micaceus]|uniref:Uncharacterized protein n=1 Tax=Coprinellus micaceus TaxID=71717 RepID=A0A4Y7T220_COPMI|nr:hypothetical protein FA13DRAFT_815875 [Coprinellus micaceus]
MATLGNHDGWPSGTTSQDGNPSVISVMPNSSSQRSENLDIRVAGRDMHATSSNVNLTLKIGVGYPDLPSLKERQSKQDEMERWGSSLVSVLLGILRTSFPSLFLLSSDGHVPSSVSESSARSRASGDLAEDGVEIVSMSQTDVRLVLNQGGLGLRTSSSRCPRSSRTESSIPRSVCAYSPWRETGSTVLGTSTVGDREPSMGNSSRRCWNVHNWRWFSQAVQHMGGPGHALLPQ